MERKGHKLERVPENRSGGGTHAKEADPAGSTRAFYDSHAQEYFDRTVSANLNEIYDKVLQRVKSGGRILDVGAGSGRDLKALRSRGFDPLGIDASPVLAGLATEFSGVTCLPMSIVDINFEHSFDAVWACASLLHLPKRELPSVLGRLRAALVSTGVFFVSVQLGRGERLLPDGRFFASYEPIELSRLLRQADFIVDQLWVSEDSLRSKRPIRWLNIIAHLSNPVSLELEARAVSHKG